MRGTVLTDTTLSSARVDEDERHQAGGLPAVGPRVAGPVLDHDIAGAELNVLVVEQHGDRARQHHRVVDGVRAVHVGMAPAAPIAANAATPSVPARASGSSGSNWTSRKTVPPGGGCSTTGRSTGSPS